MSTKRRAHNGAAPDGPSKEQKRRRVSIFVPDTDETPERTTQHGLDILDKIKVAVDKYGRPVATEFLHLPDAKQYPGYYVAIRLPLALDIIENKLKKHEYTNLTAVECDLRRMVANAKFYNQKGSQLFSNAERIRKIVVAEMPKVNPAYRDPNYMPFSTPLPDEEDQDIVQDESIENETPVQKDKIEGEAAASREERTRSSKRTSTRTPTVDREQQQAAGDARGDHETLVAERFQAALESILNDAIRMPDENGEEKFAPFINLPDKQLYKEYYDVIAHPVSLRGILKTVRGTDKRKPSAPKPKPSANFRSWRSFADEVSHLWRNARIFNEDHSDIVITAGELEKFINSRIAELRRTVPAPEEKEGGGGGPKIRLKLGVGAAPPEPPAPPAAKLKLRLPGKPPGEATSNAPHMHGVRVDAEALKRQQDLVKAGTNGVDISSPANSSHANTQSTPQRTLRDRTASSRPSIGAASPAAPPTAVNGTGTPSAAGGPSLRSRTPLTRRAEAEAEREPASLAEPIKPSPSLHETPTPGPVITPEIPPKSSNAAPTSLSLTDWEKLAQSRNKAHGNGLISQISISSHPSLSIRQPYHISLPCTPILPAQPISVTLPSCINYITFSPTIVSTSQRRPIQHYLTVCDQKNPTLPTNMMLKSADYMRFAYDVRLREGVNRVVVGASGRGDGETTERVVVFVNLLRS